VVARHLSPQLPGSSQVSAPDSEERQQRARLCREAVPDVVGAGVEGGRLDPSRDRTLQAGDAAVAQQSRQHNTVHAGDLLAVRGR
jgi:hypothetical protein